MGRGFLDRTLSPLVSSRRGQAEDDQPVTSDDILYGDSFKRSAPMVEPAPEEPKVGPTIEIDSKVLINAPGTKLHNKLAIVTDLVDSRKNGAQKDLFEVKVQGRFGKKLVMSVYQLIPEAAGLNGREMVGTPDGDGFFLRVREHGPELLYTVLLLKEIPVGLTFGKADLHTRAYRFDEIDKFPAEEQRPMILP